MADDCQPANKRSAASTETALPEVAVRDICGTAPLGHLTPAFLSNTNERAGLLYAQARAAIDDSLATRRDFYETLSSLGAPLCLALIDLLQQMKHQVHAGR